MDGKFFDWHLLKHKLHKKTNSVFFNERDVWWCHLGANVGSEQDGTSTDFGRPILVFKKFNLDLFWALPITTLQKNNRFHHLFGEFDAVKSGSVILSQLRLLDARRLVRKLGMFPKDKFEEVCIKLKNFIV